MDYLFIIDKSIWAGIAALGFAILFNVPPRTLFVVWLLGALGGAIKFVILGLDISIIMASFLGAFAIGWLSVPLAHKVHSPPIIFSIPAVIPMVPGTLAYKAMLGLIDLSTHPVSNIMTTTLLEVVRNGMNVIFILMSLSIGVAIPLLMTRKESAKRIKIVKD